MRINFGNDCFCKKHSISKSKNLIDDQMLPFIIESNRQSKHFTNSEASKAFFCENSRFIKEKLLKNGAVLIRGFDVTSAEKFEECVRAFAGKNLLNYSGGASPRIALNSGVYTSTEYPSEFLLPLHNELSYTTDFPYHLYFCCLIPSQKGGETSLGDSRSILQKIEPEIVNLFKAKKLKYIRNLKDCKGDGYGWQNVFETVDKTIVENRCRKIRAEFNWKKNGDLRLSQICDATMIHSETGEEVWFNQAVGFHPSYGIDEKTYKNLLETMSEDDFRLNVLFADDTQIEIEIIKHIDEVLRNETILFEWQTGDVLIIDNLLTAHGRMPFSGSRKIIVAMT